MNKKLKANEFAAFIIISLLAVGDHFLYDKTRFIAFSFLSPVNESIWEHIKIIFFPYLIYSIAEYFILKPENAKKYIYSKSAALSALPAMLIVFNGVYTSVLGYNLMPVDILSTFIYIAAAQLISYNLIKRKDKDVSSIWLMTAILWLILLVLFTYLPPKLALFKDAITGLYGIN